MSYGELVGEREAYDDMLIAGAKRAGLSDEQVEWCRVEASGLVIRNAFEVVLRGAVRRLHTGEGFDVKR